MILDSSAVIAILRAESESAAAAQAIETATAVRMSAVNFVETAAVLDGARDPVVSRRLDDLLAEAGVAVESVTELQARIAREAYRDMGKGSGHPARLNWGDCFAYALARSSGETLLYKGDGFTDTGIAGIRLGQPGGAC